MQANFSKAGKTFYFSIRTGRGKLDVFDERGETTLLPSASEIVLNLSPDDENLERGGYLISPEPESGWKYGEDEWYVNGNGIPPPDNMVNIYLRTMITAVILMEADSYTISKRTIL